MLICGLDEAGRGPLAGPVVVAGVIFKSDISIPGVRDSKKLSELKRESLFGEIIDKCVDYNIQTIDNKVIDEQNILRATMIGMENCLRILNVRNIKIFIDGNYFRLPDGSESLYNYETVVKGDDKIFQVSCASILAKVTRDRIMKEYDDIYPQYNFKRHKGYGTREHIANIGKYGLCEIHRITFCKNFIQSSIIDE